MSHLLKTISLCIFLSLIFPTLARAAEPLDRTLEFCQKIHRVESLLPTHVAAFYGVEGLKGMVVENLEQDLKDFMNLWEKKEPNLFTWHTQDLDDLILECNLTWNESALRLFKQIQKMAHSPHPQGEAGL